VCNDYLRLKLSQAQPLISFTRDKQYSRRDVTAKDTRIDEFLSRDSNGHKISQFKISKAW